MTCTHEHNAIGAIAEGVCPRCLLLLERHEDDHGRCPCCEGCWSSGPGEVRLVIHIRDSMSGPFTGTNRRAYLPADREPDL